MKYCTLFDEYELVSNSRKVLVFAIVQFVFWHQFSRTSYMLAFWRHCANLQWQELSLRERFNRLVASKVDWWFGYAEHIRPLIMAFVLPDERVTILYYAVNTHEKIPNFQLLLFGDGPQKEIFEAFCKEHYWAHFGEMLKGQKKYSLWQAQQSCLTLTL